MFASIGAIFAQNSGDTIVVESFNYSQTTGLGNRDTIIDFPVMPGVTFEKILMTYNMRCVNNATCGEWDYSNNTYIHDSSRVDSVAATTPSHVIGGFSGASFSYAASPTYSVYPYQQQSVVLNSTIAEMQYTVGSGAVPMNNVFATHTPSGKSQYLFTASELLSSGATAGNLDGILLHVIAGSETAKFMKVRVKQTALSVLDASTPAMTGWTEVFHQDYDFVPGSNRIQFYQSFNWDGVSNVIVEFSFTNWDAGSSLTFQGSTTSDVKSIFTNNDNYHYFNGNNYIESDSYKGIEGNEARTVEAWVKSTDTDGEIAAWGTNANGLKWVFRFENTGKLRVEIASGYVVGTTTVNDNTWHHVACVFNGGSANDIQLYVDGNLESLSSVGDYALNTDIANGINFRCSRGVNNRYINGVVDELRVWNVALTPAQMNAWKFKKVDPSHPQYANLDLIYTMNEGVGQIVSDASPNGNNATIVNGGVWSTVSGIELFKDFEAELNRPVVTFLQGDYDLTITPTLVNDTVYAYPNPVTEFEIESNAGTVYSDNINPISITNQWEATSNYIYDVNGTLVQTIPVASAGTITPTTLDYFQRWPMKFQIMSFVTPYGNGISFGSTGKTWTFDVTDFTPILTGSKRMTMELGGQWQEDMDIKFLFIVGTPVRNVLDIREIWRTESKSYTDIINNVRFEPRNVTMMSGADKFVIKTAITGHGQEGEFIPRTHFVNVNGGGNEFEWQVWKECAENPVYPQGGTWIYDRAGWCPGMATDIRTNEITGLVTAGQSALIDYGVQTASGTSNYIVSNQLVSYGPFNHSLDAGIVEVMNPSSRIEYARSNAICQNPKIRVRNGGSNEITSLSIKYYVNSESNSETYNWVGTIGAGNDIEIDLPSPLSLWNTVSQGGENTFVVEVLSANGAMDQYVHNNKYTSVFELTDFVPSNFVVVFKTNNVPNESSYELLDDNGTVLLSRSGMSANTVYKDTVNLYTSCYKFKVYDSGDDGISFFANNDGTGYVRFTQLSGATIKNFNPNYGDGFEYNFTTNSPLSVGDVQNEERLIAYPNPTNGEVNFSLNGFENMVSIRVYDIQGNEVIQEEIQMLNTNYYGKINLADFPSGVYFLRTIDGTNNAQVKIVKVN